VDRAARRTRHDAGIHCPAERISGQQLDDLFDVWLFTGEKPASPSAAAATQQAPAAVNGDAAAFAQQWMARMSDLLERGRL
jgi:hypothetical protein